MAIDGLSKNLMEVKPHGTRQFPFAAYEEIFLDGSRNFSKRTGTPNTKSITLSRAKFAFVWTIKRLSFIKEKRFLLIPIKFIL